ncbi:CueP family metal-binding protein [Demequina sp.]|uniref:CueP family metal-binding protein n=1 Tax=Demequina sp. TaxID=2050685 RepID=UPI003A89A3D2
MLTFTTRTARRAVAVVSTTALLTVGLAACSGTPEATEPAPTPTEIATPEPTSTAAQEILEPFGFADLSAKELVDTLDAQPLEERPADLRVSIRPDELLVSDASGAEAAMPMPQDAFYVSLAPYVDSTHECYFHSLTTCTGEMQNVPIDVLVTDAETGKVLIDEEITTFANGFLGLWLPRDRQVEVTFESEGRSATTTLDTSNPDDATCVTTMQLA